MDKPAKLLIAIGLTLVTPAPTSAQTQATITLERGPCMGECPLYRFRVGADGIGVFEGRKFTAAIGEHRFMASPEASAAFRNALAPFRPKGSEDVVLGHPRCKQMSTDHPTVSVLWEDSEGIDRLSYNFGCRSTENGALAQALADAPDLLPLADLIERFPLRDGEFHGRN